MAEYDASQREPGDAAVRSSAVQDLSERAHEDEWWELVYWRWNVKYGAFLGGIIGRARRVYPVDLDAFEDAAESGSISDAEYVAAVFMDYLATGRTTRRPRIDVVLTVMLREYITETHVSGAIAASRILMRAGYPAVPVVAAGRIDPAVRRPGRERGVEVLLRSEDPDRWK